MRNSVFNAVNFNGKKSNIKKLEKCVQQLIKEQESNNGERIHPEWVVSECSMYAIQSSNDNNLQFDSPFLDVMMVRQIADRFNLEYEHYYEDDDAGTYGAAYYTAGVLVNIPLTDNDMKRITQQEHHGEDFNQGATHTVYFLDGEEKNTEGEAIDDLIEDKKNKFANALLKA